MEDAGAILNNEHAVAGRSGLLASGQRAGNVPFVRGRAGGDLLDDGGLVGHTVGGIAAAEDEGNGGFLMAGGIPGHLVRFALSDGLGWKLVKRHLKAVEERTLERSGVRSAPKVASVG